MLEYIHCELYFGRNPESRLVLEDFGNGNISNRIISKLKLVSSVACALA